MNKVLLRFVTIALFFISVAGQVQAEAPAPASGIRVLVYGIHYGGNLVYNYKVINNGDTPFNYFTIGSIYDSEDDDQFPQLTRLPLGWTFGRRGETGTAIVLAPGSTSQPAYWKPHVFGQQETDNYYLNWWCDGPTDYDIKPGQTVSGFSVTIPLVDNKLSLPMVTGQPVLTGPDEKYLNGNFLVEFASGKNAWGTLEREDTTPPTLTVSLNPSTIWPPNKKLVPITATITVSDDYDPQPEIQLISITANEPLDRSDASDVQLGTDDRQFMLKAERKEENKTGRIYTVTYSATDGSGNKTLASATVTVPHDERGNDDHREEKGKNERKRDR